MHGEGERRPVDQRLLNKGFTEVPDRQPSSTTTARLPISAVQIDRTAMLTVEFRRE